MSHSPVLFDGGANGITCDTFIRSVRQRALAEGKQSDNEWVAQAAAASMEGDALFWYEEQTDEVQESWKELRRAIMQRWQKQPSRGLVPAPGGAAAPLTAPAPPAAAPVNRYPNVPTPAAAPWSPPNNAPAAANAPSPSGPTTRAQRGRIAVIQKNTGAHYGYLSEDIDPFGDFSTCQSQQQAMIVSFAPSPEPHALEITSRRKDFGPGRHYLALSLAAFIENPLGYKKSYDAFPNGNLVLGGLSCMSLTPGAPMRTTCIVNKDGRTAVFNILLDGTVMSSWNVSGEGHYSLDFAVYLATDSGEAIGTVLLANNFERLSSHQYLKDKGYRFLQVRLMFEPL